MTPLVVAAVLAAVCPSPEAIVAELAAQGVTLGPNQRVVTTARGELVEIALFDGTRRYDSRVIEGDDCEARTRVAAAFVAGWSLELSSAPQAPEVRTLLETGGTEAPLPPATTTVEHRLVGEALVTFAETGVGFQGSAEYAAGVGPGLFGVGALVSVTPDVPLGPGTISRTTLGGTIGAGLEGSSYSTAVAGMVSLVLAGAILTGRGFDQSSAAGTFELGVRFGLRFRWPRLRFLPGLSVAATIWPVRPGAQVQGIPVRSTVAWWEFCIGVHLAVFP
jgi:hypothetical protein